MCMKFFFFCLLFLTQFVDAQGYDIDSLKQVLAAEKNPEKKINIRSMIGEYGGIERHGYWDSITNDAKTINYFHGITYSNFMQSLNYSKIGQYGKAVEYAEQSLLYAKKDKDSIWMGYSIEHLGTINSFINEKQAALNYYKEALKIYSSNKRSWRKPYIIIKLAELHEADSNYVEAKKMYREALHGLKSSKDSSGISVAYYKIGKLFKIQNQLDSSIHYLLKSLESRKNIVDEYYLCTILNDVAFVYFDLGEREKAYSYILKSQTESDRIVEKGLAYRDINYFLFKYHKSKKNYQMALHYKEIADSLDKVIYNNSSDKAILKQQAKYIFDKEKELSEIENSKLIAIEREEKEKQQLLIYGTSFVLILVLVFSVFMYKRFKVTQKQKNVIELKEIETNQQKHIIEEKHREITDSINYAERIQRSFLATKEQLDEQLIDYFVLFHPKDVVSGDFYWAHTLQNGNFALVTADSTGHGVPGAIMSLLNTSSLEKAVELGINEPSEILNHTRQTIIQRLKKDGSADGGKDGMDCSLVSLNKGKSKLTYAAANNPIWIVRQNELIELKSDKMPVGKHDRDAISFTQYQIDLQKGDMIYTLTDGFPDQFGGPKGKKFMYKKLKEMLITIANKPTAEQQTVLNDALKDWMGNAEQVDDITVIGVRV